jgi:hypothetical protein
MASSRNSARSNSDTSVDLSTTEARQGVTGHNVRYVLIAGIAGVVVLFTLTYAIYFG